MVNVADQPQNSAAVFKNEKLLNKLDSSSYNKSNMDQLAVIVNFLERKSINYVLNVVPVMQDDRKMSKRKKKVINNNKYILFNSWYTKIKQVDWPNSPTMWELVKNKPELADFVFIFDHTEKLGKNLADRSTSSSSSENAPVGKKKQPLIVTEEILAENKLNSEMRDKLYFEFYKVLNETFNFNVAPPMSHIYDNLLTRDFITKSMLKFKTVALKLPAAPPPSVDYVPTPISGSKKRKSSIPTSAKQRSSIKTRRNTAAPTLSMISDNTQDTNMSD
ncbi:39K/pp31 protein [Thysanoplusia orichalcea nucleopolyhedrovirus]|uniref:39K/pp31 protein n=1 Tax=Thysanoplusia orichalcea nucleopolyhedrovirus TaxID=101850 RepID=L0CL64_9ABAC|nr:39K/pp31 protein [Thysanoplusia orichalcea nucleopolyhedrovirus]AGA16190.1 39K/pp31 protein [Thysanoplusia orichalcea nucleopolyhedrovirus]